MRGGDERLSPEKELHRDTDTGYHRRWIASNNPPPCPLHLWEAFWTTSRPDSLIRTPRTQSSHTVVVRLAEHWGSNQPFCCWLDSYGLVLGARGGERRACRISNITISHLSPYLPIFRLS